MAAPIEPVSIELSDVQSNVLRGFRVGDSLPHVEYVFLKLGEPALARAWLAEIAPHVTTCKGWDALASQPAADRFVWNVAFTHAGLGQLGQPGAGESAFRTYGAFVEGALLRAPYLGDDQESAPEYWEAHFTDPALHALISLSAWAAAGLISARALLDATLARHPGAATRLGVESGAGRPDHREHFGFVDGIGQPEIAGSGLPRIPGEGTPDGKGGWDPVPAGEIVLGYPDVLNEPEPEAFLKNGSFLIFRKLHEDVAAFRRFVSENAARTEQPEALLAARLVGRWHSGAPLALAPLRDDPALGADAQRNNDFGYAGDANGFRTPFGAHIRRANPRNDPSGPTTSQTSAHRIIRRATPYGPQLSPGASDDGVDRGVLFVVVNANIEQQFEFIQANWMNSTLSSIRLTLDADKDPIIGANDGQGKFMIPGADGPTFIWDLPRFVTVRGAAYFFLPGLSALRELAARPPEPKP